MGSGGFFVLWKGRIIEKTTKYDISLSGSKEGGVSFDGITARKNPWWVWLLPLPIVWWAALLTAGCWSDGMNLVDLLGKLPATMNAPFPFTGRNTPPGACCFLLLRMESPPLWWFPAGRIPAGGGHGSAKWGDVFQIAKKYRDKKHPKENLILTQHFQMGMDGHKHKRNTNVLVIGGSGAGKSRSYAIPTL